MSEFYKISDLSRLYNVCTDTLRYYEEQGILSPVRGENNYRLYGIQDICTLNVIRSLRGLGIPMERIREYVSNRTVDSTLNLYAEEIAMIDEKIRFLQEERKAVELQARMLTEAKNLKAGGFWLKDYEERPCFTLTEEVILENEIDFLLKKLEKKHEKLIHTIGNQQMGATMDTEFMRQGIYDHYSNVFFVATAETDGGVFSIVSGEPSAGSSRIPKGRYACTAYAGEYDGIGGAVEAHLREISLRGLSAAGPPRLLYWIDAHETNRAEEYLTEIQIAVNVSGGADKVE